MTPAKSSENPSKVQEASSNTSSAPSYASATKKAVASSPAIATSSSSQSPAVAVGNAQPGQQNGKAASPVNGRAPVTPAVPVVSTPAVAHSNGDHSRKGSVTIAQGFPNGGPVGGPSSKIQFGSLPDSPAITNSAPQIAHSTSSAPIPIPNQNPRIISPAQSPSPIPQVPQVSGGARPLQSGSSQPAHMVFGSLNSNSDGDRSRQPTGPPQGPLTPVLPQGHMRHNSAQSDMNGSAGNGGGRGGFQQGGRGRGNYNGYGGNNNMNYNMGPGGPQFRGGPNQGRGGGMPPPFQSQGRPPMNQYPGSPHQTARSPALANAIPGTPNMGQAMPMQPQQQYGAYPQMPYQNAYNSYQNFDRMTGMPIQYNNMYPMNYPQMAQMGAQMGVQMGGPPPQSPQQGYQNISGQQGPYVPGQYAPNAQPMSRSSSQISERPNSSLGQPQTPSMAPAVSMQSQQPPKPVVQSTPAFKLPKRQSAALQITKPDGTALELNKLQLKAPASPAPSARTSTPPVVVSTPTPPPKSITPQVARTDSPAAKTAEQKISEFKNLVSKAVPSDIAAAESKVAEDDAAKAAEKKQKEDAEIKAKAEAESKAKAEAESKAKAEAESKAKAEAEAKAKEEAEAKAKEEAATKAKAEADAAASKEPEESEMDRMIREMEEEDARREKAQQEYEEKKKAEKEAQKVRDEENKKSNAAEEDRKLKEAERAMEALEDEKERKRLAAEKGEDSKSEVTKDSPLASAPKTLASKLSSMTLANESSPSTSSDDGSMGPPPSKLSPAGKERAKPAALNLAPLNTKPVEAPQPSAALQSLKSARFLNVINSSIYPPGIASPNPALNPAVTAKGKSFKYDKEFLLQFQKVFTEKPSLEFESQIKALIGDGDGGSARSGSTRTPGGGSMAPRQNSNRNAPGSYAMGAFNIATGTAGKPLPPGTTSAERFMMSSGGMARPASQSFGRPGSGAFGGSSMNRVPSSSHMSNQMPQSPRQSGNRSQRNNSKRADTNNDAKAAKTMPLTAGMELKPIQVSATGWKPRSVGKAATGDVGPTPGSVGGHMAPDMVQRKVKSALNKMTPENFDKISDQILTIAGQSKDEVDGRTLRQVIQLTFEKATDEAHWASMYAKFCKRMLETMSPEIRDEGITDKNGNVVSGGNLFRKYLLNRCQEEFERGWKLDLPEKPEGERGQEKTEEAAMLSDDYYIAAAAKRRGLGLVQFIGELYKLSMLTERIMHECVKKLVDYTSVPDEAEIESLTKLLKTIGYNLDTTEKGKPMMDVYFSRIQGMIEIPDMPSRLQFMLMDIIDLRKKGWQSKEDNKGPKTLDEVRAEAEAAAAKKAAENARPQRGGGNSRMQMGRGDSRNYGGQFMPPPDHNRNTVGMDDLRRLQGNKSNRQSSGPGVFGPSSMFANRSSSGRKMGGSMRGTGDNSGASSRTGTPPQQAQSSTTSANAFSLLADMSNSGEPENPTSPPMANATPASNAENDS